MAELSDSISKLLFSDPETNVFVILDGASIPNLLQSLDQYKPEYCCLYRGEISPELALRAPYLARIVESSEFAGWLLENGWGKHWGIFVVSRWDLALMVRHFRTLLVVHDVQGIALWFRYYDPRVLRAYLPTCTSRELEVFFGPVARYCLEGEDASSLVEFSRIEGKLSRHSVPLSEPAAPPA
jgi:hypothetical protein